VSAQALFWRRNLWRGSPADARVHCHLQTAGSCRRVMGKYRETIEAKEIFAIGLLGVAKGGK
jgi:hypothetical protein